MIDIIHGNCDFRVARHKQAVLRELASDYRVEFVDGKNKGSALDVLSGNAFFQEPLAIVIDNPTKDTDTILKVADHAGSDLRLLMVNAGTIPKNSKLFKLKGTRIAQYQNPTKPWEMKPHAVDFGVLSAREMGTPISKALAESLVGRVGFDLATVWWEIKKASTLAQTENSEQIDVKHVKQTLAAISEVGPDSMVLPLERMSAKKFMSAAFRVQKHAGKDPTMWSCALISKRVILWLAVASAIENGVPMDVAADRIGKNSWYLKNQILPPAKMWGSRGCSDLLKALAQAEISVRSGASAPFVSLVCGVVDCINRHSRSR